MKKLVLKIVMFIALIMVVPVNAIEKPEVTDHEKVTIYLFRGDGCGHCQHAIKYFYELGDEFKDYFEVKTYEVWKDANNANLAKDVAPLVGTTFSGSVPLIIVGEKYIGGFGESTGETLIEYALDYYQDENYKDVVKETVEKGNYNENLKTLKEAAIEEGLVPKEPGKYDTYIIVGIFAVLIAGFAGLVYVSKK